MNYHQNLSSVDANFFYHLKTNLFVISNLSGRVLLANLSINILTETLIVSTRKTGSVLKALRQHGCLKALRHASHRVVALPSHYLLRAGAVCGALTDQIFMFSEYMIFKIKCFC